MLASLILMALPILAWDSPRENSRKPIRAVSGEHEGL